MKKRRFLSILLTLCFILQSIIISSIAVYATDEENDGDEVYFNIVTENVVLSKISNGGEKNFSRVERLCAGEVFYVHIVYSFSNGLETLDSAFVFDSSAIEYKSFESSCEALTCSVYDGNLIRIDGFNFNDEFNTQV